MEDVEVFSVKSLKLIRHQIGSMGTGVIMQKGDSFRQNCMAFWLYGASPHPQPPRNETHLSALLCLPPFPTLDEHTLHYAHLQSNKGTFIWTLAFSLCMSLPYRWQYRYVTTVMPAFARNVFYGGCSVFIWLTFILGKITEYKRDEITGDKRILRNAKLHVFA